MQNGLAGQEEEEQNEAMNAMVPTQAWDESGPPLNPPQMLNEGELPRAAVCFIGCIFSYLDM